MKAEGISDFKGACFPSPSLSFAAPVFIRAIEAQISFVEKLTVMFSVVWGNEGF
jgi:hypothetical protein